MQNENIIKGQGAQRNVINRFDRFTFEPEDEDFDIIKTSFTEVFPKTIVNQVKSEDLPMEYSMNPYQGCEHGCSYCFARPTHEYWGYSAGIDFERKIMVIERSDSSDFRLFFQILTLQIVGQSLYRFSFILTKKLKAVFLILIDLILMVFHIDFHFKNTC